MVFLVLENPGLHLPVMLQVLFHPSRPVRCEIAELADEPEWVSVKRRALVTFRL